jgi:DNA-binding transcriptional regulator YiaG
MAYTHVTRVGRFRVRDRSCNPSRALPDGTPLLSARQLSALERRAARTVLQQAELVTGAELKFARKALGLRQTELAEQLGVAPETVSRWENGTESFKRAVQLAILALLHQIDRRGELPVPRHDRESRGGELIAR